MHGFWRAGVAAGLAMVVMSGCNDSGGDKADTGLSTPLASSSRVSAGSSDGTVQAGQTYHTGQAVKLPFEDGSTKGTVEVAVTSIEQGAPADLQFLDLGDQVKGMTPFYIRVTTKNVGTTDLSGTSPRELEGVLGDGSGAQGVSIIGDFAKCQTEDAPDAFMTGKLYRSCFVTLAPAGSAVTAAKWVNDPYDGVDKFITWKA